MNIQYGVERLKNAFKSAYMTHTAKPPHFARCALAHGLREHSNHVGHAYMTYMVAGGRWPVSDTMQPCRPCLHDPHPHGQPLAILTSICLPF
jgi:hypothetical protein